MRTLAYKVRVLTAATLLVSLCAIAQAATDDCVRTLSACPNKPNCIATNDGLPERRYPPLEVNGEPNATWTRIVKSLLTEERTAKVEEKPGYLYATVTSAVFGFVDDIELTYCNSGKELWIRSASRKGYWDIGANRARVESLAEKWRSQSLIK